MSAPAMISARDITWEKRDFAFTNAASVELSTKGWWFVPDVEAGLRDSAQLATANDLSLIHI